MTLLIALAVGLALAALAAVLLYAAARPDTFSVQRSVAIGAGPERVFPLINDFDHWLRWSPYEKRDPAMKRTRSGPGRGVGAAYAWESTKVGAGRMEIVESVEAAKVGIRLDFLRPIRARNLAEFTLTSDGALTRVTWTMRGPQPYIAKLMSMFVDMDHLIGRDFTAGLESLKSMAEAA